MTGTSDRIDAHVEPETGVTEAPHGSSSTNGRQTLPAWRYSPDAWRWSGRMTMRYVDLVFRSRSARVIPHAARVRFVTMGIPADAVDITLGRIRSAGDWSNQWIETAQRFLGDYRRQASATNIHEAAQARKLAALCYHAAQVFELDDERTVAKCRAAAASLFTQTLPQMHPNARHVWIPWRTTSLPAYFRTPEPVSDPVGLVVLLNGVSMSKEETFAWGDRFIERNYAVLSLDSPGTGEATAIGGAEGDHDDILDGVFAIFEHEPMIDLERVVVVGTSLGGNQAVRCAAYDRRIMAAVAVTPPYDPARWMHRANPLLQMELGLIRDGKILPETWEKVAGFSLVEPAVQMRQPLLVFGGGRDVLVPPNEAQLLAERVGERATISWYPTGGHCLYEVLDAWTFEAAVWIEAVGMAQKNPELKGNSAEMAAYAREVLVSAEYLPKPTSDGLTPEEEFTEYARLIGNGRESDES